MVVNMHTVKATLRDWCSVFPPCFLHFKKITDLFLFIDLDALGKPPSGILAGNGLLWLGSYIECTRKIDGAHYCLAEVDLGLASILLENSHIDGGDVNVNVS